VSEAETLTGAAALGRIGPIAANSLLRCGIGGETALLSFDFATALALTERSFGGEGRPAGDAPEQLPRSAALMVEEAASVIARAISRASLGDAPPPAGAALPGDVIIRSDSAARLKPFDPAEPCLVFTIAIANHKGCEWHATLALAAERIDRLLPGEGRAPAAPANRQAANGLAAPFADVPLPLCAVLADIELPLARLATLAPGEMIPLAMGRQVPLKVGEIVLAHGSVGTAEDRMAISLTRLGPAAPATAPVKETIPAFPEGVAA
jgi:flagellar motor switch/type III secretory pathway protein FliN